MRYEVVHEVPEGWIAELTALVAAQWWCRGRSEADVRHMLGASDAVVALREPGGGALLGFARALSDGRFRAHVYDVVVADGRRGRGLGKALMEAVMAHPKVAGVEVVHLDCADEMAPFYARCGFGPVAGCVGLQRARPGFVQPVPPDAP